MKKQHVVVLGATYRPFRPSPDLDEGLTGIEAPKGWKDKEKIAARISEKREKRNAELGSLWPSKKFATLRLCYYDGSGEKPLVVDLDEIGPETDLATHLAPVCDALALADRRNEAVQFVGVGVRDILRILRTRHGVDGLLPYQRIADQRDVIDAIGMLHTGDVARHLDSLYLLRDIGIRMDSDYVPGDSRAKDCNVAVEVYNTLCRGRSQPHLTLST